MRDMKKIKYSMTVDSSTIDDKFDAKKMEVSNTVTLKSKEIDAFHAENIADVLNTVPGVTARKNEGDIQFLRRYHYSL